MKNVLVFPCGSEIGLEIHSALNLSTHFNLFGASSVEDHGRFIYKNYIDGVPYVDNEKFIYELNKIIAKFSIDFIIPAHDSVVLKLASAKAEGKLNCDLVTSPLETCEIARSKLKTYKFFKEKIQTPDVYESANDIKEFPIFIKPDVGQGSRGAQICYSNEEVRFYQEKDPSLLILEYLPGKEYTIDCFTNKEGALLVCEARERNRIQGGISVSSRAVNNKEFKAIAKIINSHLQFRGVWFFQVKEDKNGKLVLLEIAPRVAGTMALTRCRGANLVLMSLFDLMDIPIEVIINDFDISIDRALTNVYKNNIKYSVVYLDLDDSLIYEENVSPRLIAFVYQCLNNEKKVKVITRHSLDSINETLSKHRLSHIFDEIIMVRAGEKKTDYLKEKDAILIDDSFSERKQVHESLGIPVFDTNAVEALTEWNYE